MRKKNFGMSVWVIFLFYSYSFINGEDNNKNRQTFVIRYKDGEQTIPVTVVLDYKKETEYVINMNPRTPAKSVTLYDFKQRTIAYKDLTNQECFLGRLTYETLNEESSALQDLPNPVEGKPKMLSLDPGRAALTPTEIRNIAGQKTAVFCRKMNTWLLMPDKTHSIGKRDADEYEERTYHHHGFHTVQYSHYGRETRRRYRNPDGVHKHRPLKKQVVAESENEDLVVPQVIQSSKGLHLHKGVQDNNTDNVSSSNLTANSNLSSQMFGAPHSSNHPHYGDRKKTSSGNIFTDNVPHNPPHSNRNNFGYQVKYPNFVAEFSSTFGNNELQPNSNAIADFNTKNINRFPILNHGKNTKEFSNIQLKVNRSQTEEGIHTRTERATSTTDVPTAPNSPRINDPLLHSSPVHTFPLQKPLSQEFDFDSPNIPDTGTSQNNQNINRRYNIESESHPSSTLHIPSNRHRFINVPDHINPSENSDVSTNVLEIPKITKEFENIKSHENYVPQSQLDNSDDASIFHSYPERYPYVPQIYANGTSFYPRHNLQRESFLRSEHVPFISETPSTSSESKKLNEENSYIPPSEIPTTTEFLFLTTPRYFARGRTLSNNLFSPTHRTAHKNLDEINSARIVANRISDNNFNTISPQNRLSGHPVIETETKVINKIADPIKENSVFTTAYPLTDNYKPSSSHRSDIPSEDQDESAFPGQTATVVGRNIYPSLIPNKTSNEEFSPYKIRYQSVLRDFKPDEIVINIENIPTAPPPLITLGFHQRIFTTIVPTIRSLPADSVRNDPIRTSELTSGTTWQTFIHTTRHPRRRIIGTTRKPVQSEPSLLLQNGLLNQNHRQSTNKIKQHDRIHNFRPAHQSNRLQFDYSERPNPPSHMRVPTQLNQPHFNQLENLPPGVSVHPRHPQAPYANMVNSNRPPTIPLVDETHAFLKPHRQRHHRRKDQLTNSCCRSRGKSGSSQSCCRNGGPCCSRAHRRTQPPGASCCPSTTDVDKVIPTNQIHHSFRTTNRIRPQVRTANHIQPPLRISNQIQPPLRTEEVHRSEMSSKDRCEKEKMCRTLYESTQKVMVCRNAHIEGC